MAVSTESDFAIFEGEVGTLASWSATLGIELSEVHALASQGVFQRAGGVGVSMTLRLNMVGLLITRQKAFFCFPKIVRHGVGNLNVNMKAALAAIKKYHKHIKRSPESSSVFDGGLFLDEGNLIDHFIGLIEWTQLSGLHHEELECHGNESGAVDWSATIKNGVPVHRRGSTFYPEVVFKNRSAEISDLGRLQAHTILLMCKTIGELSDLWIDKFDVLLEQCAQVVSNCDLFFDDRRIVEDILAIYQRTCSRDEDIALISLLSNFYHDRYERRESCALYGVTAFHVVWEHMCACLLSSIGDNVQHAGVASQPCYDLQGARTFLAPQRPDILRRINGQIIIGDAKWYVIEMDGLPGTSDAIKQFAYQQTINDTAEVLCNFLLVPTLRSLQWAHLGQLSLYQDDLPDVRFPPIQVVGLGWEEALKLYAGGGALNSDFVNWLAALDAGFVQS